MNFKKKSKAIVGITIILTIFFSAGAITAGAYSYQKKQMKIFLTSGEPYRQFCAIPFIWTAI
ncbi:MAG: hypothetical protein ACLUOI_15925 [Eisenbergiella sp.]